jgi:hypothetical protein
MQTRETAQKIIEAMRINYNFLRVDSSIKKTPAEQAGINLDLGENRIQNLIRMAAKTATFKRAQKLSRFIGTA